MLCAVFLWSISTFVTPYFVHSKAAVVIFRVILGLGEGLGKDVNLFIFISAEFARPNHCTIASLLTFPVVGLPTIFHIFANTIPAEERSKAFGYLIAFGSIGQTLSSIVSCHTSQNSCSSSFWLHAV